jgi:hypothetical protein
MKYIITEGQFEDSVIQYLNEMYGDLKERKKFVHDNKIFFEDDNETIYMCLTKEYREKVLLVDIKTIWRDLETIFLLSNKEIKSIIKNWFEERYGLKIDEVLGSYRLSEL